MFENEVTITESDKEHVLYHIRKVNEILDKYPHFKYDGTIHTNMSRAKTASKNAEAWISNLYTHEVK